METQKMEKMRTGKIFAAVLMLALLALTAGCRQKTLTEYDGPPSQRPDYLPEAMFKHLPEMPADFYQVRGMVRTGEINDLGAVWPEYYLQPEWFPQFEEAGVPLLQNPPEDRWGAFGFGSYPSDTVATLIEGETLKLHFYMRSSYLVETHQGISLGAGFPESTALPEGYTLPDGTSVIQQENAGEHFDVEITPTRFVLKPNFPMYAEDGTQLVEVNITAKEGIPPGNYVLAVDVGAIPPEQEAEWIEQYPGYVSGGMTKIGRPYYRAFLIVGEKRQEKETDE